MCPLGTSLSAGGWSRPCPPLPARSLAQTCGCAGIQTAQPCSRGQGRAWAEAGECQGGALGRPWSCGDRGHLVSQKLWAGAWRVANASSNCRLSGQAVERDEDTSLKSLNVRAGMAFTSLVHPLHCPAGPREGQGQGSRSHSQADTLTRISNRNPDGWFCPQDCTYCWWKGVLRAEEGGREELEQI